MSKFLNKTERYMKKLFPIILSCLLLSACGTQAIHDSYSSYHNKTAEQLYNTALRDLKKGHYNRASNELEAQNALYPFGAYAKEGMVTLIYAYYKNDENDEALATADRYLRLYPMGQYADYAYYIKGVIAFGRGLTWMQKKIGVSPAPRDLTNLKDAFMSFDGLVHNFPHSQYIKDSLIRMRYIRNIVAEKELDNANFYYQRGAYVAAANRASEVVEHFDGAPAVIPALVIMVKSYRHLGLNNLADNTLQIFEASYPNSSQLKTLK